MGSDAAKPATAARIYDYLLGGVHNFPADREAARLVMEQLPGIQTAVRSNRSFMRRAVRELTRAGLDQFLDVGSGIPTTGNVHEIAQAITPQARIVYVDIDPVAVAESLEILDGNPGATAIQGTLTEPRHILEHPTVGKLLDPNRPVVLLLSAVLHFIPDDTVAYNSVAELSAGLPDGSHLVLTHAALDSLAVPGDRNEVINEMYRQRTSTPGALRTRVQFERFFEGCDMLEPGVVWLPEWRPSPEEPDPLAADPPRSYMWAGVGRRR